MTRLTEALLPFAGMPVPPLVYDNVLMPHARHTLYDADTIFGAFAYLRPEHDPFEGTVTYTPGPVSPRVTIPQEEFFEIGLYLPDFRGRSFEWTRDETGPFANEDWQRCDGGLVCVPLKAYVGYSDAYLNYLGYRQIFNIAEAQYVRLQRNPDGTVTNPTDHRIYYRSFCETQIVIDFDSNVSIPANVENWHV